MRQIHPGLAKRTGAASCCRCPSRLQLACSQQFGIWHQCDVPVKPCKHRRRLPRRTVYLWAGPKPPTATAASQKQGLAYRTTIAQGPPVRAGHCGQEPMSASCRPRPIRDPGTLSVSGSDSQWSAVGLIRVFAVVASLNSHMCLSQ